MRNFPPELLPQQQKPLEKANERDKKLILKPISCSFTFSFFFFPSSGCYLVRAWLRPHQATGQGQRTEEVFVRPRCIWAFDPSLVRVEGDEGVGRDGGRVVDVGSRANFMVDATAAGKGILEMASEKRDLHFFRPINGGNFYKGPYKTLTLARKKEVILCLEQRVQLFGKNWRLQTSMA